MTKLATCYWHSVEFGLVKQLNETTGMEDIKAYGAGLLSSFGELHYSCKDYKFITEEEKLQMNKEGIQLPQRIPWDPNIASITSYPITTYQPTYFVAENFMDAKKKMRQFCEKLPKPFYARYNALTESVWVDRAVRCNSKVVTMSE